MARKERILVRIDDLKPDDDLGKTAGWGSADDLKAGPSPEDQRLARLEVGRVGAGRYAYNGPGSALILLYIPGIFALLYILLSVGVPALFALLLVVAVTLLLAAVARQLNRKRP